MLPDQCEMLIFLEGFGYHVLDFRCRWVAMPLLYASHLFLPYNNSFLTTVLLLGKIIQNLIN